MDIQFGSKTVTGRRESNQDSIFFMQQNGCFIAAVADGMGGYGGGEVASRIVADVCREKFVLFSAAPEIEQLERTILKIIASSQEHIKMKSAEKEELSKMGTTLTVAIGYMGEYVVGNIGDSRTYLISGDWIEQLTKDNSMGQEYREKFSEEERDSGLLQKISHALTKSLSGGEDEADIYPGEGRRYTFRRNDKLVLCSDGLILDKIGDTGPEILRIVGEAGPHDEAAESLVNWAYENESADNISVIIVAAGE
ncbi:MAG: serine/threonine-protein phosphatase [Candidatus Krumholzibacteria bacterium]|nr:serine/threonine-protein phosphatase [Candidatus Krumholzibacteria bacterium]